MTAQLIFTITSWDNCIGLIACTKSCLQLRIHSSVARKLCVFEVNTLYSELWCSKNNAAIPFCLTDFCVVFFLFFLDFCWCWENRIKQWQKNIYFFYAVFVPGNYKHRFPFPHKWWNSVPIKKSDSLLSRYQLSVTWPMFLWMDFLFYLVHAMILHFIRQTLSSCLLSQTSM